MNPSSSTLKPKDDAIILASLPPSPTTEEDLTAAKYPSDEEPQQETTRRESKGKAKETQPNDNDVDSAQDAGGDDSPERVDSYPPINDEDAENQRIEENLRRWELAERLRRKAARESANHSRDSSSIVGDVTSLLWPSRKSILAKNTGGLGIHNHAALKSRDSVDGVPLNELDGRSPRPSTSGANSPIPPTTPMERDNPFLNPPETPGSPFADENEVTAIMHATSEPPTPSAVPLLRSDPKTPTDPNDTSQRPILVASSSSFQRPPPPPKPLGLPNPQSPPPRSTPFEATPPPVVNGKANEKEEVKTRWWHEVLCGCGEGPDRGGDDQAGRTNPFE